MKQGNIERVFNNKTKADKDYKTIVINGVKYNVFDTKLFNQCLDGTEVSFEYEESNGYRNITSIHGSTTPSEVVRQPSANSTSLQVSMCNASNNTYPFLQWCHLLGINVLTEPEKLAQALQLWQNVTKELAKTIRGE